MRPAKNILLETEAIKTRWKHYFQDLRNSGETAENIDAEETIEFNECEYHITKAEVEDAIKKMKTGKAPGEDELPAELIKAMEEIGTDYLTRLFNISWKQGRTPDDWGKEIVCPIFKKGDKANCKNYREISLLSHTGKINDSSLEGRLRIRTEIVLGEWQNGRGATRFGILGGL
jgi:hypothetical protein